MVTVGMNYRVIEGKESVFESMFDKVVVALQGVDGHEKSHMFRDVRDPRHYLIISRWANRDAFDAFMASDAFKATASQGREEILSDRPQHEIYGS